MLTEKDNELRPEIDLSNCDREPIHVPGSIQPHGLLLVLAESDLTIVQASENIYSLLGVEADEILGSRLERVLGFDNAKHLEADLSRVPARSRPAALRKFAIQAGGRERLFQALAHRTESAIVVELELSETQNEPIDICALVDALSVRAEAAKTIAELSKYTAEAVRELTGFDRVLIYQFDDTWSGAVVGEAGTGRLPKLLNHRFPASDIPAQARELYRINRIRIIPDASYTPVRVVPSMNPVTGKALDMTFSTLRSVSPVHVEYMRNMRTAASMSVSILREGRLWGLISCHHQTARTIPFAVRENCDLFARAFTLRLSGLERAEDYERRIEVRSAYSAIIAVLADRGDFAAALCEESERLLALAAASGAAILADGNCMLLGSTPTESQVVALADWLFNNNKQDVFNTDALPAMYPASRVFKDMASGLLAIALSKLRPNYVFWFRPEVIKTVEWGGNPNKPVEVNGGGPTKLHPRRSFETWKETVQDKSHPWRRSEVDAAAELRNVIVGAVLRKAEELAELNAELTRSNKELEAFSYSVSHDLRAPLRHIVGYAEIFKESAAEKLTAREQRCIATIIESSEYAGRLVDKLLAYSRLGRTGLEPIAINMNALLDEVRKDVSRDAENRQITWQIAELSTVVADPMMLRMAVRDLISNAVKYTRMRKETLIEVGCYEEGAETVFWVRDNGVGFDMQYADKLFGVFQRLHRWEDFEGTGIGLANVRRVIERHGGRTWANGAVDQGATFYFSLPHQNSDTKNETTNA